MYIRKLLILLLVITMVSLVLVACSGTSASEQSAEQVSEGRMDITNVKANMTLPSDTGSFWMEITNNTGSDDVLLGAEVEGCDVIELHNMFMEDDVMIMRQVEGGEIPIPAGETILLKKGGLHIMCIGKEAPLDAGSSVDIALQFATAGAVEIAAEVVEPGEMPMDMAGEEHSEMEMGKE